MKSWSMASASIPINKCVLLKRILTDVLLIDFRESVGNNCQKFSALLAFNQMFSLSYPSSIIFSSTFFTRRDRFVFWALTTINDKTRKKARKDLKRFSL